MLILSDFMQRVLLPKFFVLIDRGLKFLLIYVFCIRFQVCCVIRFKRFLENPQLLFSFYSRFFHHIQHLSALSKFLVSVSFFTKGTLVILKTCWSYRSKFNILFTNNFALFPPQSAMYLYFENFSISEIRSVPKLIRFCSTNIIGVYLSK